MPLWKKAVAAYLTVGQSASAINFTAQTAGIAGNSVTITIVVSGSNTALSSSASGNDITIDLATNGTGVATSTVNAVIAAVNADSGSFALVQAAKGCVGAGLGLVGALSQTHLAGGVAQSAPNWVDAVPATQGWRSNESGELLVVGNSPDTIPSTQATVKNAYVFSSQAGRSHYNFGNVTDEIILALEYSKPVYQVRVNLADGAGNLILIGGDYRPTNITVSLINPGVANAALSGTAQWVNFNSQLNINIYLATGGGGAITSTIANINSYCVTNIIPLQLIGSGVTTARVLSGPWTDTFGAESAPTVPITIGVNTRSMTYLGPLAYQKGLVPQSSNFRSPATPVPNFETLLFGYKIVSGDAATAGNVQIGTGWANATHAFGSANSELTVTANVKGSAGNSKNIILNSPISANVGAISSSIGGATLTYNLKTHNGVAATHAFGTSNAEITFTANTIGAGGNSITITMTTGGGALSVSTSGNAVTVTLALAGSTVAAVIAACAADSTTNALVTATTTGNGTGTVIAATITSLSTGANATSNTLVSDILTFAATDPNTATFAVTLITTGNGTGTLAGIGSTALSGGVDATCTIDYTTGNAFWTDELDSFISATFVPPDTSAIAVN